MGTSEKKEAHAELHPLDFFLPERATLLMLGSFPPKRERWSMEFFYPNLQNDMWRIFGLIFFGNKDHFLCSCGKRFDRERIIRFLTEKGIALGDTARSVRRLRDNASDQFLEVVERIDLDAVLGQLPHCRAIVTTGQKATDTLLSLVPADPPVVGGASDFRFGDRPMRLYRMPSSSRAYPRPLESKAEAYAVMFRELGLL